MHALIDGSKCSSWWNYQQKNYVNDIRNYVTTVCSAVDDCNTYCDDIDQSILDKLAKDHEALKALTTMVVDLFDATSVWGKLARQHGDLHSIHPYGC